MLSNCRRLKTSLIPVPIRSYLLVKIKPGRKNGYKCLISILNLKRDGQYKNYGK